MPQKGFLRSSELVQQARPPIFFGVVVGIDLGCENDAVARWRWLAPPGEFREPHPSTGDFSTWVTGCTAVARFLREESFIRQSRGLQKMQRPMQPRKETRGKRRGHTNLKRDGDFGALT